MAKDPAFLFYTGDFTTGTQFMSDEQVGKYLRLLMAQHQHGRLSEKQVIFICKNYDKEVMLKFEKDESGFFFNRRLEKEISKRKAFSESRSNNKLGKKKNTSKSYDFHMENENENRNKDLNIIYKSEKEKKSTFGIGGNVKLTKSEYDRMDSELGSELFIQCIDFLSSYKREKDYKTKDDNLTIRRWVIQAVMEKKKNIQKINDNGGKISKNQSIRNSAEEAKRLIREDIAKSDQNGEVCY